jgi:alpha-glucosidase
MTLEHPSETAPETEALPDTAVTTDPEWWRSAVIYQVYPRSFADSTGDGIGDLIGITRRLPALVELGVDALWLSPFYTSPQHDGGYDVADYCDVDPLFGTLDDFRALEAAAHDLGLRVIVDLVPNHSSSDHPWFREALASPAGSEERARYLFREGTGPDGASPPNNWESVFGGPAWTRVVEPDGTAGEWYLHLFDDSQPDFDWENPWVHEQFRRILRFWLDLGVDGFRIDVAQGMVKEPGMPDYLPDPGTGSMGGDIATGLAPLPEKDLDQAMTPYWGQNGVHEIFRDWRRVLDGYDGDRVLVAEAWIEPLTRLARWVRPDEMHQAFNFAYLETPWSAPELRRVIDDSLSAFAAVGAPSTWVLSNHDVIRHASRLALTAESPQGHGIGPRSVAKAVPGLGLRRARAATALMLALPGSAYLYQGEELGLPEATDIPDDARQDPTWFRTGGERYGRDGCRVPIPWEAGAPASGFSDSGESWLPQPADWSRFARDAQRGDAASTFELYRLALSLRRRFALGDGEVEWLTGYPETVVALRNSGVTVIVNLGEVPVELPVGELLLSSHHVHEAALGADSAVWMLEQAG